MHRPFEHRHQATGRQLPHTHLGLADFNVAVAGLHAHQRCARHIHRQFTVHQGDAPLCKIDIHRRGGVELQAAAIGQRQAFALARGGMQIGPPRVDGQLAADQPGRRHQRGNPQGTLEDCASPRLRAVEAGHRQCVWQVAETLAQGLGFLPGLFVVGMAVAPLLQRCVVTLGGRARLQQGQPLGGGTRDIAAHNSTSKQCS